jgi:hypothetical protein
LPPMQVKNKSETPSQMKELTWSATRAFIAANHVDPVESIIPELAAAWGEPSRRLLASWPLSLRAGRFVP